jgi:DNA-directed RNA polymerase specialized sigma24 family protein
LQAASDSIDICQTVLMKFLATMYSGRYPDLGTEVELRRILGHIAKNVFRDLWRKERSAHLRGLVPNPAANQTQNVADSCSSPSQHVAQKEFVILFLDRLSDRSRLIHTWRISGWDWARIGAELGQPPNTARIRFERECKRVAKEMGL